MLVCARPAAALQARAGICADYVARTFVANINPYPYIARDAPMSLDTVWDAIAKEELSRKDCSTVDLVGATTEVVRAPEKYTLRAEGHLVYGISQIWDKKAFFLRQDSVETEQNMETAFSHFLSAMQGPARVAPPSLDLVEPDLGSGFLNTKLADRSIDNVVRSSDPHDFSDTELLHDDIVRSEAQLEELEHMSELDFGLDDPGLNEGPDTDLGSDIPYSSSPPHTPRATDEPDVAIGDEPRVHAPRKSRRRARQAPLDEEITISIPSQLPSKIRRRFVLPAEDAVVGESTDRISLGSSIEKLLDPESIEREMRHRSGESVAEEPVVDVHLSDDDTQSSGEVQNDDFEFDLGPDYDEPDFTVDVDEPSEDEVETQLRAQARAARSQIRAAISKQGEASFDALAETAPQRACMLMEVLALASRGEVLPEQSQPFAEITLRGA